MADGAFFAQLMVKQIDQVSSRSYDVISRTTSGRFITEIAFSATRLLAIDWNGDIMRDLGQNVTIFDL